MERERERRWREGERRERERERRGREREREDGERERWRGGERRWRERRWREREREDGEREREDGERGRVANPLGWPNREGRHIYSRLTHSATTAQQAQRSTEQHRPAIQPSSRGTITAKLHADLASESEGPHRGPAVSPFKGR